MEMRSLLYIDVIHLWWIPLVTLMLLIYNLRSWIRTAILVSRLPGPPALPLVGNVLQFYNSRALTELSIKLYKQNAPLVRIWATVIPVIVLFSPDFIQTVLNGKEHLEKSSLYSILKPSLGNSLVTASVENWQKHRKIINPTFHMRVLENFVPVFVMNSKRMVAAMKKFVDSCEAFDVTEFSFACTLDIICETTMGTPVNAQDCNLFRDFSLTAVIAHDILIHRLLKPWLLLDSFFKFTEGSKTVNSHCFHVDELSDKVVQRRRETMKASKQHIIGSEHGQKAPSVFLDSLLKLQEEGYGLSDVELINEVKTIIMAGHETASQTASFCLYLLGLHPEIQVKVHEELNSIFEQSNRDATLEDLRSMKYLERCLLETLRLFPAVPVIGRRTTHDIILGDYKVPAGCELMIPIMLVHRQKKHFLHPNEFNPDNFLHENIQQRHSFAYLPFSAGPRNCIGQRFALLELKALVSTVLRSHRVESISRMALENLTWKVTLKTRHPMLIKLHPHDR